MNKTTIDSFGRVLIPKDIRFELGLEPGDQLGLQVTEGGIQLTVLGGEAFLVRKGRALVFTGRRAGNVKGTLRKVRDERLRALVDPEGSSTA